MDYKEGKQKFIHSWGTLGTSWGINKAMAQIHALLLISPDPLSTEQVMQELLMSRGNVNMNMRSLMEWGIVKKEIRPGERREYFYTGKDIWELARQIARERKKREIEPIIDMLAEVRNVTGADKKATAEFKKVAGDLHDFTTKVDGMIDKFSKADQSWFYKLLVKF